MHRHRHTHNTSAHCSCMLCSERVGDCRRTQDDLFTCKQRVCCMSGLHPVRRLGALSRRHQPCPQRGSLAVKGRVHSAMLRRGRKQTLTCSSAPPSAQVKQVDVHLPNLHSLERCVCVCAHARLHHRMFNCCGRSVHCWVCARLCGAGANEVATA